MGCGASATVKNEFPALEARVSLLEFKQWYLKLLVKDASKASKVRIKCPHCSIILDLPEETTKFKCAKCLAVCNITASQQSTTPEHIFAQAGNIGPILGPPGSVKKGDSMPVEQLVGYLILEIRDLRRRNVDDDAVRVEKAPKLEAAVAANADLNGDGIITEDELRELYGTKEDPIVAKLRVLAQQADLNGDGVVTDEELMKFARMAEIARAADVDGDGHISEQEMAARYGDSEFSRKFLMLTSSEGSDSLDDTLSEEELTRIVARVGPRVQIQEASQETDEEKAKKMLATHLNKQQTMANLMDADRKKKEDELQKQLRERRQRKMALKRMTNEKNLAEAGADIDKIEKILATISAEAMQDGVIDEDEQRDIDAAKAAIAKARTGVTSVGLMPTPNS